MRGDRACSPCGAILVVTTNRHAGVRTRNWWQRSDIQRGLAFAGAFIASVPVLVFYAFFQRKIIAGITTAGLAGR